jgi:hypothetical protein
MHSRWLCFLCVVILGSGVASAERIVWARGAVHFGHECPPPAQHCRIAYVPSPNHRYALSVTIAGDVPSFEVLAGGKRYPLSPGSFVEMDALWAPDSSALSLAWNSNALMETTQIYTVDADGVHATAMAPVQTDFVRKFPPCVGNPPPCEIDASGKDYNYLTVAWSSPHTVVMMAEVPGSSRFGANLGGVTGYEVDARTGAILRVLKPREFKRRWQWRMGWNFNVADASGG